MRDDIIKLLPINNIVEETSGTFKQSVKYAFHINPRAIYETIQSINVTGFFQNALQLLNQQSTPVKCGLTFATVVAITGVSILSTTLLTKVRKNTKNQEEKKIDQLDDFVSQSIVEKQQNVQYYQQLSQSYSFRGLVRSTLKKSVVTCSIGCFLGFSYPYLASMIALDMSIYCSSKIFAKMLQYYHSSRLCAFIQNHKHQCTAIRHMKENLQIEEKINNLQKIIQQLEKEIKDGTEENDNKNINIAQISSKIKTLELCYELLNSELNDQKIQDLINEYPFLQDIKQSLHNRDFRYYLVNKAITTDGQTNKHIMSIEEVQEMIKNNTNK